MPHPLDAAAVRAWSRTALNSLARAREEIDAINVYPVADGDTGTNLYLTLESAGTAVEAVFAGHRGPGGPTAADALRALAHGALLGARGNSGTILAQLLRGMSEELAADGGPEALRRALRRAAAAARQAVAHPVEGTMLTVADAAAEAAGRSGAADTGEVAVAACLAARAALARTPAQLGALGRAGVVDAGGRGLVVVLAALAEALGGRLPAPEPAGPGPAGGPPGPDDGCPGRWEAGDGPAFEVIYLLEAADEAVAVLRERLDALGDSLVVVGGDGLWRVHVHVDDAGAAVEAGVEAGRPHRIRVTHFDPTAGGPHPLRALRDGRRVVAVVEGEGLAALYGEAGAVVVRARPDAPPAAEEIAEAVRRAGVREAVLLPGGEELRAAADAAARQARTAGLRVALIPTRSAVQGIAALAVHTASRRFEEDVVAMTAAAGATRYAQLAVAERESWTMAGVCQAGDALGLIDGDVAVIGGNLVEAGAIVLDRMLAAGGEMVTLVLGAGAPADLADRLRAHVAAGHLAVDTVVYTGGQHSCPLLIGVE